MQPTINHRVNAPDNNRIKVNESASIKRASPPPSAIRLNTELAENATNAVMVKAAVTNNDGVEGLSDK